jgi:hypothetical protein
VRKRFQNCAVGLATRTFFEWRVSTSFLGSGWTWRSVGFLFEQNNLENDIYALIHLFSKFKYSIITKIN